jgi:quinol-cytochrome oxidoreductase complex cytochrome b subunit
VFFLAFFTWLATYRAVQNDERIANGEPPLEKLDDEKVLVWPDLVYTEMICMIAISALLIFWAMWLQAPLEGPASSVKTPNPSKAPWYFLGLQELLRYFHPMVAGVLFAPTLVLLALAVAPYIDRNPSTRPGDRKIAITLFTMLIMFGATLTIIGSFFRGTGYNWVWPWAQGVFFEL